MEVRSPPPKCWKVGYWKIRTSYYYSESNKHAQLKYSWFSYLDKVYHGRLLSMRFKAVQWIGRQAKGDGWYVCGTWRHGSQSHRVNFSREQNGTSGEIAWHVNLCLVWWKNKRNMALRAQTLRKRKRHYGFNRDERKLWPWCGCRQDHGHNCPIILSGSCYDIPSRLVTYPWRPQCGRHGWVTRLDGMA